MHKVFIEGGGHAYETMWKTLGWYVTNRLHDAECIQFTGGADVDPDLYGEAIHPQTGMYRERDARCINLFNFGQANDIPMAGICRGGQFLNVMNGGKMFQHCDGHAIHGTHKATILESGLEVDVTSTHHQIMRPNRDGGIVLMDAKKLGTFKEYMSYNEGTFLHPDHEWGVTDGQEEDDIEAIYYPNTNSLCFQPHPEYCKEDSSCMQTYKHFLKNYLELDV